MAIINGRGRVGIRKPNAAAAMQIVSSGLILNLDAGNAASYPGTGQIWYDISGNGRNGTFSGPNGGPASYNIGGYINFDGVDDVIQQSGNAVLATDNFTIEVWCRPTSTIVIASESTSGLGALSGQKFIVGPQLPTNHSINSGAGLSIGTNGLSVVEHGDTYIPSLLSYNTTISSFTQIVITYTNKQPRAYINGNLVRTGLTSLRSSVYLRQGSIGGMYYGYFAGGLANIKYYNRALSAAEIQQNLNALAPRFFPQVSDTDAQAFVYAAGLTSSAQANAINTLVTSMKTAGIWAKMKAIYPMVGGSAASHKFNLKDPRNLDAAFRLTFTTGWVHSSTGAKPNGVSDYANTFLSANLVESTNHLSYYSRTQLVNTEVEMGIYISGVPKVYQLRTAVNYVTGSGAVPSNARILFTTTNDARGFWLGSKRSNGDREIYLNGISQGTSVLTDATTSGAINYYIGARNDDYAPYLFSTKECAFASIGDGLTDAETASFYTAVQAYQTSLGRQV